MAGTFLARTEQLLKKHEGGKLRGEVVVDQVYARYQHENLALKHTSGGKAKYLWDPVLEDADETLRQLAVRTLRGNPDVAMIRATERWSRGVAKQAPIDYNRLKTSSHPRVKKGGRLIYDRPPITPRVSEAQLAKEPDIKAGDAT